MTDICISQVEYSNDVNGVILHVFGRDKEGKSHRLDVTDFKPYFYIPSNQIERVNANLKLTEDEYKSIRGEPLRRVYTKTPGDIYEERDAFTHYEADVNFNNRFLIDMKIKSGVSFENSPCTYLSLKPTDLNYEARTMIVDIECSDERGFPDASKDPIICVTCYDSFEKRYTSFLLTDKVINCAPKENGCFNPDVHDIVCYKTERDLLEGLSDYIRYTDPDILTGWNFNGFDMPYILGRMDVFGIPREDIARLQGNSSRVEIRGRQIFDLLAGYKRMHLGEQPSYRLDAIAAAELGKQKIHFNGRICDLWRNNPEELLFYNFTDVELCVGIDAKDKTVEFHRKISHYVGCQLEKTTNSMPIIDIYILRKAYGRYVLPSKAKMVETEKFQGATVFAPPKGIHENVAILDLTSLYPMIMMTINASPETKDPNGELKAPNGICFKKHPDGLVREIQSEWFKERSETKAARNTFPFGSPEYVNLDMQQNVMKIMMNSYYGVSGSSAFRLFDREIGDAVTSVGRKILEHNRKIIEAEGYPVVMGDTDSCGARIPKECGREETMAIGKRLEKLLNNSYSSFAKDVLNADVQYFSIKFEKLYERFFSGGKKKRYAGLLVWKEGKDVHEVDIVGFETERSDTPMLTRETMRKLFASILEGVEYGEIKKDISGVIKNYRKMKYPLEDIGIPGGIGKALESYENPSSQVRGAMYSNKYLKTNFSGGSKPKRLLIKAVPSGYERTDVICFEYPEQVPRGFVIDVEEMLNKTLKAPISRVFDALGWDWNDFDPTMTNLSQWGLG